MGVAVRQYLGVLALGASWVLPHYSSGLYLGLDSWRHDEFLKGNGTKQLSKVVAEVRKNNNSKASLCVRAWKGKKRR